MTDSGRGPSGLVEEALTRLPEIADTLIYRQWPAGKGIYAEGEAPEMDDPAFLRALRDALSAKIAEVEELRARLRECRCGRDG